jgi:heparosan-N-sulfate-glucuronate 5-epimerase
MSFQMFVDDLGIPYSDYGHYRGIEIGRQRSILSVAERGLVYWNRFFAADEPHALLSYDWTRHPANKDCEPRNGDHAFEMLINCADWLLDSISIEGNFGIWRYSYPMSYGTSSGWASSHAQAVGISLLLRAAELSKNRSYIEVIDLLLNAFEIPLHQGGLLDFTDCGEWWYEKFASKDKLRPKVLNGMLFALLGLDDITRRADSEPAAHAQRLFDRGLRAAIALLPCFDSGAWSNYDIFGKKASPHYHAIHIAQLDALYQITGRHEVAEWRDRFRRYQDARNAGERAVR